MLFLLLAIVGKATAQTYTLGSELTWDQVKGGTTAFALVSGTNVLYGTNQQNLAFNGTSSALSESNSVVYWKVENASGSNVYFRGYNLAGNAHTAYDSPAYLNSQPSIGSVTFVLNNKNTTEGYTGGQDMNNGAVWTVIAVSGGYTIKNVGNNGFLAGATTTATAEKVWKFYSVSGGTREDFVFTNYDENDGYTLRPIRQYGKDIVYADDVTKKVTLHGVMDTPNAFFNNNRWAISNWENRYNNDQDVANCLAYFEKTLSAYTNHQAGSYCDVFRLHLDPAWTNDPNKTATNGGEENDISRFSADRLRTYMTKLYWPIAKKAIDKGMYVIMRPPGVCPQNIQVGGEYQQYLMTVWDIVSKDENVKKYAGMIMIELANEPINVLDTDGTNSYGRASVLHDFFQPIVDKIRANGFKGIVLSSGATWQQSYQGYGTKPITGDNIGYAVHWYPGWYSTKHYKENVDNQTVINNFKNNIPVVESSPIVVTEVDWSPEQVPQVLDHKDEYGNPVYKNYGTWATGTTTSFGKNFKAVHDYFGNISMTLTHPYEYVDFDQLFNNNRVTYSFQNMAEPREACAYTCFVDWYPKLYSDHSINGASAGSSGGNTESSLTSMFHKWTSGDANAAQTGDSTSPAFNLNTSTDMVYGYSTVDYNAFADLSEYEKLVVTASAGSPRFLFNRDINEGAAPDHLIEIPGNAEQTAKYQTVVDNGDGTLTYTINLQAIVADKGFAHLHAIKDANWAKVTVTSIELKPIDNCLKITTPEAKTNVWDWQVRFPLPTTLAAGKTYTIEIVAKAANETSVGVWPTLLSDESNPQFASINVTNEWTTKSFDTNGAKAYDYLFFNIGKVGGDFMVSNIKITDKSTGTVVLNNNMNDNSTWTKTQNELTLKTVSSDTNAGTNDTPADNPPVSTADPNFHIYLCFGQSNMEGNANAEDIDMTDPGERFLVLMCANTGDRTMGNWYNATPPLCRIVGGNKKITPADYFGRTMIERLPDNVKVGVLNVAMGGAPIEDFDKDEIAKADHWNDKADWYMGYVNEYGKNPYKRLIDMAKEAQKSGVIKGILLHQGCSNNGQQDWPTKVNKIYSDICSDLGLNKNDVPLLVGELLYQNQGGSCYGHNTLVNQLATNNSTIYAVSAEGIPGNGNDGFHFNAAGYREIGKRYANKMCDILNISYTDNKSYLDGDDAAPLYESELTTRMFKKWNGNGADAEATGSGNGVLKLNESTDCVYGLSNIDHLCYADLSKYGTLKVTITADSPRFFFNTTQENGANVNNVLITKDNTQYLTKDGNTYIVNLQAIVKDYGYAHLNSIKASAYNTEVTATKTELLQVESDKTPVELNFTEAGSKEIGRMNFQVSGDGVTYDPITGTVSASKAGGKIFIDVANADLSAAQSVVLSVQTSPDPYSDICNTGSIYNNGTSINTWYGSKYNMQNLDKEASVNNVAQGYNWNEKMGNVTRFEWNIDKVGYMVINKLTVTSGVPDSDSGEEVVEENYIASTYGRRPIDNKHPMWLMHVDVWNQADPQKIIDLIPEDIKPYVVMNLSLSCSYDKENDIYQRPQSAIKTYKSWGSVCQQNGMWFTCQPASGGHTHIMDDDLETFEYFFKQYPNFLGWNYAEQFWGFNEAGDKSSTTEETRIALFAKLIPMHHKYGGFLTISFCGSENSHALNPVGMLKRNADLLKASEDYPDAILWLYKYTHPVAFYNNESVTFGPFVAGLAKNYGVRYDNCGYNYAVEYLYGENSGIKYPTAAGIGTVMEQMAQNGGAVWDGPELIWTEDFQNLANSTVNGYTQRNWGTFPGFRNIWIDMFRKVIDGTIYIPTQKEVQAKTKIAIVNDVTSGTIEDKYGTWGDLYDNLYKVNDPLNTKLGNGNGQMQNNLSYQKSTGRYGTIPMMPELYTTDAKAIPTQVNKSQRNSIWATLDAKKAAFDAAYPEVSTGDLFISRYKNQLVTYNPYSNLGKTATDKRSASANVPLKYNTCQSMDLTWANYSSAIVKEHRDRIDFYLNNYRTDTTTTVVDRIVINGASSKPSYTMTKRVDAVATATETWSGNTYTLEINHMGPVDLTINCAGTAKGRSTNIVSDAALSTYNMPKQPEKFVGTIIKEAEDMNYKSIQSCVDNYWYQDKNLRGHAGNGIMKMGTNTNGGLTTNVKTNSTESYNVTVRYCNTDKAGNISLTVGGSTKQLALEKTAVNEWKKATIAFDFTEGSNTFKLDNNNGINFWVDQVEFTPASIAAEEYDIVLGTPENGTVTSDKTKATEGTKVTLTVTPASGFALNGWKCGFTKVTPLKNVDGTYSFTMPDNTVTITPLFKDVSVVYQLDIPSTVNSSLPEGWRTTEGTEVREYGHQYGSGPRIFTTFTGTYTHALYWRCFGNTASADYGKLTNYPLELKAGTYRLSYRVAAWNGTPKYKAQILNYDGSILKTTDDITATPNASGVSTADLSSTEEKSFEFSIPANGNYVINFIAPNGGEFLLLDCRINALSIDPGQDDPEPEPNPEPEEFNFNEFLTEGGAKFNRETHEYTGTGKGGWTFAEGKDVSGYQYLVITSAQNRNMCKTSTKIFLNFNGTEIDGETTGNGQFTEKGKELWLDQWNHNNIIVINLKKLKDADYDVTKLNSVKFNLWGDTSDKFYPNNVYLTNTLPDYTNGDFKNNIKVANKFGTICLPYAAAYSGAIVYEITGKDSGSKGNIYMSRVDGLMEAGKAYFYYSTENYSGYQEQANYNVYFYKASDIEVTTPVNSNGLVGTFERITAPIKEDKSTFVLSSNKLYYVNSTVAVGANKAYIDLNEIRTLSSTPAKAFSIQFFGFQEETAVETADATTPAAPVGIYNISGARLDRLQKGVNILRFSDNTTKTVIIK